MQAQTTGRIDVHSHLLPGIDDGCKTLEESIACAKRLVQAGYTHSFCTPHIWPSLPGNTIESIVDRTSRMQDLLDEAKVRLKLIPGGELNLRPDFTQTPPEEVVSYAMAGRYVLFDFWSDKLPPFFAPSVRWLQNQGLTAILAHPERIRAIQDQPELADQFTDMGLLLQGNLQCFGDAPGSATRVLAEEYLLAGRYFMVGSDLHNLHTLPVRMNGLARVTELVGEAQTLVLTRDNPRKLVPEDWPL